MGLQYLNICRVFATHQHMDFGLLNLKVLMITLIFNVCVCVYVHSHFKDGTYEWFNSTWCYRLSISPVNVSFKDLIQ